MVKAAVIGVGSVGSCIAFKLATEGLVDELVLLDVVKPLAEGQAMDIEQSSVFISDIEVKTGEYEDISDANLVVIAAGKPRTPSMKSRLELAHVNAGIIADIARRLRGHGFNGFVVTVTNPVDLMNLIVWKIVELDRFKVLGSSSLLDTVRFRTIVAKRLGVKPRNVEGYVVGEHGKNQVPLFSRLKVMGKLVSFSKKERAEITDELRGKALDVISRKGATVYAPVSCTVFLIESLLKGGDALSLASLVLEGEYGVEDVSIGVPFKAGQGRVNEIVEWSMDDEETRRFMKGVSTLKKSWEDFRSLVNV